MRRRLPFGLAGALLMAAIAVVSAVPVQFADLSADLVREPAIGYFTAPATDRVARLNDDIQRGAVQLTFDPGQGYLPRFSTRSGYGSRRRLLRYPCSYLIYSDAFDALPPQARDAIYERMWKVLAGKDAIRKYARLSAADRRAIVEILRDTKTDLPAYFR